ncbi:MAG: hypothetical protein MZW92_36615 [Comamonadaceae bacterium]|nr:hypothetical protein [Comamonadaceae bacterium]
MPVIDGVAAGGEVCREPGGAGLRHQQARRLCAAAAPGHRRLEPRRWGCA